MFCPFCPATATDNSLKLTHRSRSLQIKNQAKYDHGLVIFSLTYKTTNYLTGIGSDNIIYSHLREIGQGN